MGVGASDDEQAAGIAAAAPVVVLHPSPSRELLPSVSSYEPEVATGSQRGPERVIGGQSSRFSQLWFWGLYSERRTRRGFLAAWRGERCRESSSGSCSRGLVALATTSLAMSMTRRPRFRAADLSCSNA